MTEEQPAPAPVTPARRIKALVKFLCVLSLLFVAWFLFTQVAPRLVFPIKDTPAVSDNAVHKDVLAAKEAEISALSGRIEQLEAKLRTFEEIITASQGTSGDADERITALQEKIAQIEAAAITSGQHEASAIKTTLSSQNSDISGLKAEMEKLKTESSAHMAVVTAFSQLQDAVIRGESFAHHIETLHTLLPERADVKAQLAQLAPHALKGVIAEKALAAAFEPTVTKALAPNTKPDSVLANIKSLVRVRKVGTPEGTDDESVIARAETALHAGRVEESILSLRELSPPAAIAFREWVALAQDFVMSRKTLDALKILLAQTPPSPPAPPPASITSPAAAVAQPELPPEPPEPAPVEAAEPAPESAEPLTEPVADTHD